MVYNKYIGKDVWKGHSRVFKLENVLLEFEGGATRSMDRKLDRLGGGRVESATSRSGLALVP
jgi:hypothetical protein